MEFAIAKQADLPSCFLLFLLLVQDLLAIVCEKASRLLRAISTLCMTAELTELHLLLFFEIEQACLAL